MKIKTTAFRNNYPAAIMILIILISSFTGRAQTLDGKFYQPSVPPYSWQSGWFKTNLNIPKSAATTGRDTGAIYYKLSDSSMYVWTGSQWVPISGMTYPGAGIPLSTGSAWNTSITNNSANWNTAFGWGNHAGLYPLLAGSYNNPSWLNQLAWSKITGTPTTIGGYGISDGLIKPIGSGVIGAVPFFTGGQQTGNTSVYWDNTNSRLGVNQPTPVYPFDAVGDSKFTGTLMVANQTGNNRAIHIGSHAAIPYSYSNTLGNIVIGDQTTSLSGIGSENIRIGRNAGKNQTGEASFYMGTQSGDGVNGRGNIIIGPYANYASITQHNRIGNDSGKFMIASSPNLATYSTLMYGDMLANRNQLMINPQTTDVPAIPSSIQFGIRSTTRGFLPPVMNGTQMNAIASPVFGLVVANTDSLAWCYYDGTVWKKFGGATGGGGSMVYPGAGIPVSTGSAWGTSITDNSANWNTAFGWGNHAGLYPTITRFNDSLTAHTTRFNGITTSLSGKLGTGLAFLLSDTAAKTWAWTDITGKPTIVSTETDPVYSATAWASSLSKIVTWDSAYARSTRNSYINNATGSGDTILIPTNDSIMVAKRIKLTAGTNISITPNITGSLNEYTIAATGGGGSYTGSKSVLLTSADFTLVNDSTTLVQDRVYAYSSADATRGWKKTNVTNFTSLANKDLMWYNSSTGQWNNVVYNLQKVTEAGFTTDQPVILEEGATFIIPAGIVLPAANRTKIYTKSIGGKPVTATYNADGNEAIIQPLFGTKNIRKWLPAGNSTTIVADGAAALTATGTATAANVATTNRYTIIPGLEYLVTTAATTAVAGFREAAAQKFMGNSAGNGGFTFICTFGPATGVATTTNRLFVGFTSGTGAPTDVEPSTLTNMFGVGWDAADANIQFMSNDGTGTATKTSLGIAVPTADRTSVYRLEMYCPPNSTTLTYTFRDLAAGGSVVTGTVTTDLPAVNTLLAARGWMSVGGTSSVIGIALKSLYIESDF